MMLKKISKLLAVISLSSCMPLVGLGTTYECQPKTWLDKTIFYGCTYSNGTCDGNCWKLAHDIVATNSEPANCSTCVWQWTQITTSAYIANCVYAPPPDGHCACGDFSANPQPETFSIRTCHN